MTPPTIRSERVVLDAVLPSDADAVFLYCQDDDLQTYIPVPVPYTRPDAERYVTDYARQSEGSASSVLWAIRVEDRFAGVLELRLEPLASSAVGFWLGGPWRRRGIMVEALETVIEYAFDEQGLALTRMHWEAVVGNLGSATVAHRAGFAFEGTIRRSLVHREERLDSWQATLLASDSREETDGWPL